MKMFRKDEGFTLVELMVVVLIIGILVAIAVPVFLNASANAAAKSCQANQRTLVGAIQTYNAQNDGAGIGSTADGLVDASTGGKYAVLFSDTGTVKAPPKCPTTKGLYTGSGVDIVSDKGASTDTTFTAGHGL